MDIQMVTSPKLQKGNFHYSSRYKLVVLCTLDLGGLSTLFYRRNLEFRSMLQDHSTWNMNAIETIINIVTIPPIELLYITLPSMLNIIG